MKSSISENVYKRIDGLSFTSMKDDVCSELRNSIDSILEEDFDIEDVKVYLSIQLDEVKKMICEELNEINFYKNGGK